MVVEVHGTRRRLDVPPETSEKDPLPSYVLPFQLFYLSLYQSFLPSPSYPSSLSSVPDTLSLGRVDTALEEHHVRLGTVDVVEHVLPSADYVQVAAADRTQGVTE